MDGRGASPPTRRVVAVMELLAGGPEQGLLASEVVKRLRLSHATAHAVLGGLVETGWAVRDPLNRRYALGPTFLSLARSVDGGEPPAGFLRTVLSELAADCGYPASAVVIADGSLVTREIVYPPEHETPVHAHADQQVPFVPPFGPGFVAWSSAAEQAAWAARSPSGNGVVTPRIRAVLAAIRERGYTVERLSDPSARLIRALGEFEEEQLSDAVRPLLRDLLAELTSIDYLPVELTRDGSYPVGVLAAPVFDGQGRVAMELVVHPFERLTGAAIEGIGMRIVRAAEGVTQVLGGFRPV
ncbi:helix-turn-helix domain-containing protein [Actinomadura kijaniata]|nr:helix-turn-helix domain-containing protein [Actinomadura namibiensis]